MAGTIINTPATGASDWTGWIVQQGKTDKGFLRVSLTNPSSTAASLIATGSVLECAGSIYQFTETSISLDASTASSSVAFYYTVIPSGGGTTVTVVRDSVAPTWIDSKQGFYASAASTTRYIGGAYIGTAATYFNKFIYTPQMLDYLIYQNKTRPILKKIFELGEWNMDADLMLVIAHNLGFLLNIKHVSALIYNDPQLAQAKFTGRPEGQAGTAGIGGGIVLSRVSIVLRRRQGGYFDNINYDGTASTVANRGFVHIEYEA